MSRRRAGKCKGLRCSHHGRPTATARVHPVYLMNAAQCWRPPTDEPSLSYQLNAWDTVYSAARVDVMRRGDSMCVVYRGAVSCILSGLMSSSMSPLMVTRGSLSAARSRIRRPFTTRPTITTRSHTHTHTYTVGHVVLQTRHVTHRDTDTCCRDVIRRLTAFRQTVLSQ